MYVELRKLGRYTADKRGQEPRGKVKVEDHRNENENVFSGRKIRVIEEFSHEPVTT